MAAPDMDVIKEIPGYKVILKAVLKSQIQQLVEQLASHTDEESVILTASVSDGTLSHLGSDSGKFFLDDHEDIKSQFLGFCLKRHHRRKQEKEREEALRIEREEAMRNEAMRNMPPANPYGMRSPPGPRFMQRSPRMTSPRQPGLHPVHLSRVSPGSRMRHEPYPMNRPPKRTSLNFEPQGPPGGHSGIIPVSSNTIIKIEPDDDDDNTDSNDANTSQTQSQINKTEPEHEDDTKSNSSTSTIPNDNAEVKFSDTQPAGGLGLDSDLSNLITGENSQQSDSNDAKDNASESDTGVANVKMEAISEAEMELEITGVEPGRPMVPQDNWVPNTGGFDQPGASGSPGDMQGYKEPHSEGDTDEERPNRRFKSASDLHSLTIRALNSAQGVVNTEESTESLDQGIHDAENSTANTEQSTDKQTKWAAKMLKEWMMEVGYGHNTFEWLPLDELDTLLQRFYASVQTKDGDDYSKSALVSIRSGLNRHLTQPPTSRMINLMKDREFNESNKVFLVLVKILKDTKCHKEPLDEGDIQKLFESGCLNDDRPATLQNKVLFDIICHFDLRGRDCLRELKKSSFVIESDSDGKKFVTMTCSESDKSDDGQDSKEQRKSMMYEIDDQYCPVRSFEKYLKKLSPESSDLFQKPLKKAGRDAAVWYSFRPVGLNMLSSFMSRMSETAGLTKRYTNACIRSYFVSRNSK